MQRVARPRWGKDRATYTCADATVIETKTLVLALQDELRTRSAEPKLGGRVLHNGIKYSFTLRRHGGVKFRQREVVVARARLTRDMREMVRLGKGRTAVFPESICHVRNDITCRPELVSVVTNEGLWRLTECLFQYSSVRRVVIASSVLQFGERAFYRSQLEQVVFREGSNLDSIGEECFWGSRIREFVAPPSLRRIG